MNVNNFKGGVQLKYQGNEVNKIIILGSAGSGKSYLSKKIAEHTGFPLTHLDNEYWNIGWVPTPKVEWVDKIKNMIQGDQWIIDGNYNSTLELRYKAADCIIFLDMNRFLCIYNVWKRHGKKRSDLPEYLEEKKDKEFLEFLVWIWNYKKRERDRILQLHKEYPEKLFLVLKSRKAVNRFIKSIK